MNLKIKYILPIFAFIPTQIYAFAPETPDEVTSVSADTVKIKGEGEVNIVENDSTFLREVFESDTFDKLIELDMATSEVHLIPDSVIIRRLRILDARSPFSSEFNPEVRKYINMYLGQRKALVARMVGLSLYYYDLFDNVLDRYGIPLELKHLVVIESAMNPKARSRVGASGLWQFMYGTGRMYNLYTDSYVDERFDPHKSTEAAAKMLKTLYDDYKDWNLALAAYNYGSGNVNKAIARSGGKRNFWEVRAYMPLETQKYVSAFIAANYVMSYYREHNIIPEVPRITYAQTDTINVKSLVSFDMLAKKLDMPVEEIQFLNPAFKLGVVPYTPTRHYSIVLPADKAYKFASIEQDIYSEAKAAEASLKKTLSYKANTVAASGGAIRYKVRSGDTLGAIAIRYGVSVSKIKSWNRLKSDRISIGQRLLIYPRK